MMNEFGHFGSWGFGFGWIFMLLFLGVAIAGVLAIVKWLTSTTDSSSDRPGTTALQILEERYARGEIEREEFEQKRSDLLGD